MISLIFPCKNRLDHLKQCLPTWIRQDIEKEIIIVDYNCPQKTGEWVKANHPEVRVIKALLGKNDWNLSAARNIGIKSARYNFIGIFDADTLMIFDGFLKYSIKKINRLPLYICGQPIGKLHGCCIAPKNYFEEVGGYNEFLQGWGFEDASLYNRFSNGKYHEKAPHLTYLDLEMIGFDENLVDLIRHEDSLRVQYQKFKNIQTTNHNNSHIDLHSGKFRGLESNHIKFEEI